MQWWRTGLPRSMPTADQGPGQVGLYELPTTISKSTQKCGTWAIGASFYWFVFQINCRILISIDWHRSAFCIDPVTLESVGFRGNLWPCQIRAISLEILRRWEWKIPLSYICPPSLQSWGWGYFFQDPLLNAYFFFCGPPSGLPPNILTRRAQRGSVQAFSLFSVSLPPPPLRISNGIALRCIACLSITAHLPTYFLDNTDLHSPPEVALNRTVSFRLRWIWQSALSTQLHVMWSIC